MTLEFEIILRIVAAVLIGIILGIEREYRGKPAGMRTYALVTLGSTLFTLVSQYGFKDSGTAVDPSRIASQIVTGIGFLGGGIIIVQGIKVRGVTTAAGLWVSAAIGMALGAGMYFATVAATAAAFVVMVVMRRFDIEHWLRSKEREEP